jgi:hypothetical protein
MTNSPNKEPNEHEHESTTDPLEKERQYDLEMFGEDLLASFSELVDKGVRDLGYDSTYNDTDSTPEPQWPSENDRRRYVEQQDAHSLEETGDNPRYSPFNEQGEFDLDFFGDALLANQTKRTTEAIRELIFGDEPEGNPATHESPNPEQSPPPPDPHQPPEQ